jgi:hypothetical protein
MEEERSAYLTVPTVQPEPATNQEDALIGRQPGEEEDAYHVRSTCESCSDFRRPLAESRSSDARLEVQGVYGDGWDEGVERTRGRAIKDDRRSFQCLIEESVTGFRVSGLALFVEQNWRTGQLCLVPFVLVRRVHRSLQGSLDYFSDHP